ncbi:MAG: hypothetical protein DCF16_05060 [Alphaproteobacteria bacterium]|nr:MAG: hypothetical protein DCF16_05060 [Alphaproteobacteria bacterium]
MTNIYIDADLTDEERRARLYAGDIFLFSPTPASLELVALGRRMIEEAFAPHDPQTIHLHKSPAEVAEILAVVKPAFIHHPEAKRLLPMIMAERGVDLDKLYFDVPRMRSAYPSHFLSSGIAYAFHPHRDTWYSAPQCQLNWWLPIYPVDPNNGMGFYPRYFDAPIANNSEIYNYYEWNTKSRASAAAHVANDTRQQPKPQAPVEGVSQCYIVPPGGIILFSGAQLHETVPNTTDVARYSIDFRTVHLDDVSAKRGAPNVDAKSTGTTMRDYLRASDLSKLPEELVALYDDGSATPDKVLYFGDRLAAGGDQGM